MMALPGRIVLKQLKSSGVILEKGSLSGAAAGEGVGPSARVCSFRQESPNGHEVAGSNLLQGLKSACVAAAGDEKVLRCLRAALSFSVLWKIPTITGEIACSVGNTGCRKEVE